MSELAKAADLTAQLLDLERQERTLAARIEHAEVTLEAIALRRAELVTEYRSLELNEERWRGFLAEYKAAAQQVKAS